MQKFSREAWEILKTVENKNSCKVLANWIDFALHRIGFIFWCYCMFRKYTLSVESLTSAWILKKGMRNIQQQPFKTVVDWQRILNFVLKVLDRRYQSYYAFEQTAKKFTEKLEIFWQRKKCTSSYMELNLVWDSTDLLIITWKFQETYIYI